MISIQIQSIIYCNDKTSLNLAIEAVDNATKIAKTKYNLDLSIELHYGDAGPQQTYSTEEIKTLNEIFPNIKIFYTYFNENTGSAKGHNILAKNSTADYLLIMNPDVKLSPHFFYYILSPFSNQQVGMVEARQTPVEHQKEYNTKTLETEWATTACAAIRRGLFEQLNGFDSDTFFLYCDDLDFSWRLRLKGYIIIYQPLAPVYHAKKLTNDGKWIPTKAEIYYSAESSLFMAHKWSNPKRVEELLNYFKSSNDEVLMKVVTEYNNRKRNNKLPEPIDPEHKVAKFMGNYYSENRFVL